MGTSSGTRISSWLCSSASGSGRSDATRQSPWLERGASRRAARPSTTRLPTLNCTNSGSGSSGGTSGGTAWGRGGRPAGRRAVARACRPGVEAVLRTRRGRSGPAAASSGRESTVLLQLLEHGAKTGVVGKLERRLGGQGGKVLAEHVDLPPDRLAVGGQDELGGERAHTRDGARKTGRVDVVHPCRVGAHEDRRTPLVDRVAGVAHGGRLGHERAEAVGREQAAGRLVEVGDGGRRVEDRGPQAGEAPLAEQQGLARCGDAHAFGGGEVRPGDLEHGQKAEHEARLGRGREHGLEIAGVVQVFVGDQDPAQLGGVDLRAQRLDEARGLGVEAGLDQDRLARLDEVGVHGQVAEWPPGLVVREHDDVFACRIRRVHEASPVVWPSRAAARRAPRRYHSRRVM